VYRVPMGLMTQPIGMWLIPKLNGTNNDAYVSQANLRILKNDARRASDPGAAPATEGWAR